MNDHDPIVGNWYRNLENNSDFVLVASDDHSQTLEVQYADGQLEEFDLDTWQEMLVETIEPPEDYAGALEALSPEDLGYNSDNTGVRDPDWTGHGTLEDILQQRNRDD